MNVERSLRRTIWSESGRHPDVSQWKRTVPSTERGCVYTEVETDSRTSHSWVEVIKVSREIQVKGNGIWKYEKRFEGKITNIMPMKLMTVYSILFKGIHSLSGNQSRSLFEKLTSRQSILVRSRLESYLFFINFTCATGSRYISNRSI